MRRFMMTGLAWLVVLGLSSSDALAQRGGWKIFGTWRSTSGNIFVVNGSEYGGFNLTWIQPSGQQALLRGSWVQGLRGTQFQYWDLNGYGYTGTFSSRDPNRIRVTTSTGATTWWYRHVPQAAQPAPYPQPSPYPAASPYPAPSPYPHARHHRRMACWSPTDPGCGRARNGMFAMNRTAFASFMTLVRSAKPHVFTMKDRVQTGLGGQYLTSAQLVLLLQEFKPHIFPMLDVVKACAPRVVDPENGVGSVAHAFSPHTMIGSQAAAVLSAQRGDL